MDKPLEFLKKYWENNHYTDITENPEPDFNSNFFIAIRNLMSDFNIYANSEGKPDNLKSGDCNLQNVSKRFLVTYRYTNRTDATIHEDEVIAENCVEACNKVCSNHNWQVEWHTVKEKTDC